MISIIIPTRNRGYTLNKVLDSYYSQNNVNEIIIIDDCGNDNTEDVVYRISNKYSNISTKYIKHDKRKGAAGARITGYTQASNEYILFGEDDAYLAIDYSNILLKKLLKEENIGLVSGRLIFLEYKESLPEAEKRFNHGILNQKPFSILHFGCNVNAKFEGDIEVPFTHALFLTRKSLLIELQYDPYYSKGNGYREESDFQVNAFLHNKKIIITNETRCFHMSRQEVRQGGQRSNRLKQLYWNMYYTNYFYSKYFLKLKKQLNIPYGISTALFLFFFFQIYNLWIRPISKLPNYLYKRFIK